MTAFLSQASNSLPQLTEEFLLIQNPHLFCPKLLPVRRAGAKRGSGLIVQNRTDGMLSRCSRANLQRLCPVGWFRSCQTTVRFSQDFDRVLTHRFAAS